MVATLLALCGCSSLNETTSNKIESSLEDKYGIKFEVSSIGGRSRRGGSGTVQTYVYPQNDETLHFNAITTKEGELKDDYIGRIISENINEEIKGEMDGVELQTSTNMFYLSANDKEETNLDITLAEYVEKYSPRYITTSVIVKENSTITSTSFQLIMEKIHSEIPEIVYYMNVFLISDKDYESFLEKPSSLSFFDKSNLKDYKILNEYRLYIDKDGFKDYTSNKNK
ncbi:hypothetical protein [Lysinibacillus halotolerans]|uniref:hypothetical protein n=1 Tax=Lysinibacillus halotolerans TaxID=1368476 RepID=UPI0011CE1950|nr:hypothetical protein [Lysinibacillus halotolerans]